MNAGKQRCDATCAIHLVKDPCLKINIFVASKICFEDDNLKPRFRDLADSPTYAY